MSYALQSAATQMELVRTVHINVYKYYLTATELLLEYKGVLEQLAASENPAHEREAEAAAAAAADGDAAAAAADGDAAADGAAAEVSSATVSGEL
jgi:hypothetical protein